MRASLPLAALAAAALTASAAHAQTTYKLDKIEINGVKSVPTPPLLAGLKDHSGETVTTNDLLADQDALSKELEAQHVVGGVKTSLRNKNNGHIDLIFDVDDQGVQAPKVVTVAPKLGTQSFVGNNTLSSEDLAAATGLKAGDDLSDAKIQAAQQAILAAYKKANKVNANITGAVKQNGESANLVWTIAETKAKKKRKTEDEGTAVDPSAGIAPQ
ncbi:MAG TPA: POTRA domain-containing protein [Acetobacteraceae bacterium]|nr:POTRA domain-containing protein [Acetobacteraceae bacterium]